jgi:hypothetical protein
MGLGLRGRGWDLIDTLSTIGSIDKFFLIVVHVLDESKG